MSEPTQWDPESIVTLAGKVASCAVRWGVRPDEHAELSAVACEAIVRAVRGFDPSYRVAWQAFAWRAGTYAVHRYHTSYSTPFSGTARLSGPERGALNLMSGANHAESALDEHMDPDESLAYRAWCARVRESVRAYAAPGGELDARLAEEVLLCERKPAEVADAYGVDPVRVYQAVRRVRARIEQSAELYEMWKQSWR